MQTDASNQAHFQLEEGHVEEREASPWVALDKEVDFIPKDVTEDTYRKVEATLVQDSVVQNMANDEQMDASSQAQVRLEDGLLKKRETSLDVSPLEELEEGPVDEMEASPRNALDEEVDTFPNDATEDTYNKEDTLVQDSAIQDMDHEVQFTASSQAHLQLEEGLLEDREASLKVFFSKELEEGLVEERKASPRDSLEEMATMLSLADGDTSSVTLETIVAVILDDMEVLQQGEVEEYETQDFLVQDCDKKKKKGVRAFFCGFRKMMTCCFCFH